MAEIIEGMAKLQSQFRELELSLQRKALLEAARAGGEILRIEMAARAPRDSGEMAESIKVRTISRETDAHEASVSVGPDKRHFYWYFQEHGTIRQSPKPFMEPAYQASKPRIIEAMRQQFIRFIQKAIR